MEVSRNEVGSVVVCEREEEEKLLYFQFLYNLFSFLLMYHSHSRTPPF